MKTPSLRPLSTLLMVGALTGCARGMLTPPSLSPRAAEAIDPRLSVERALVRRPVNNALAERLASLVAQARAGDASFRAALGLAERSAAAAGPARSETWVSAQQALSQLEVARADTPKALGAIDALAGEAIKTNGGIGAAQLAAIEAAGRDAGAIDAEQRRTIAGLNARLAP